jgi:hypothetical protein
VNDDEVITAVRESFAKVRPDIPLEQTVRRGRARRARHRAYGAACAAGTAVLAGVTAAAVVVNLGGAAPATSGTSSPSGGNSAKLTAWTVATGPGGTVDVTIRQLLDPAGLERTLRADGIPANVAFQSGEPSVSPPLPPECQQVAMSDEANANLQAKILPFPPNVGKAIVLAIRRSVIPEGIGIYLAIESGSSDTGWGWGLDLVKDTPACTG